MPNFSKKRYAKKKFNKKKRTRKRTRKIKGGATARSMRNRIGNVSRMARSAIDRVRNATRTAVRRMVYPPAIPDAIVPPNFDMWFLEGGDYNSFGHVTKAYKSEYRVNNINIVQITQERMIYDFIRKYLRKSCSRLPPVVATAGAPAPTAGEDAPQSCENVLQKLVFSEEDKSLIEIIAGTYHHHHPRMGVNRNRKPIYLGDTEWHDIKDIYWTIPGSERNNLIKNIFERGNMEELQQGWLDFIQDQNITFRLLSGDEHKLTEILTPDEIKSLFNLKFKEGSFPYQIINESLKKKIGSVYIVPRPIGKRMNEDIYRFIRGLDGYQVRTEMYYQDHREFTAPILTKESFNDLITYLYLGLPFFEKKRDERFFNALEKLLLEDAGHPLPTKDALGVTQLFRDPQPKRVQRPGQPPIQEYTADELIGLMVDRAWELSDADITPAVRVPERMFFNPYITEYTVIFK